MSFHFYEEHKGSMRVPPWRHRELVSESAEAGTLRQQKVSQEAEAAETDPVSGSGTQTKTFST